MDVKWSRSSDGYVESKCGRYRIKPIWAGRVQPIWYQVEDASPDDPAMSTHGTHRECKAWVERRINPPVERDWPEVTKDML